MKKLFSEIPVLGGERVTLRPLTLSDADSLRELTDDEEVYRYLPTFLYEQKYDDKEYVVSHLYDECLESSLILGVFEDDVFCGLAEIYGYRAALHKASVGYRLVRRCWGRGIATETLGLMVNCLLGETDVRIITASAMIGNQASANVLRKNGFRHLTYTLLENWGRRKLIPTEKWIKTHPEALPNYRFH